MGKADVENRPQVLFSSTDANAGLWQNILRLRSVDYEISLLGSKPIEIEGFAARWLPV